MSVFPSYNSAYFDTLYIETSPGNLPDSFVIEFPKNDYADSAGGILLDGQVFSSSDSSDYSVPYRVYDFERVEGYYYNPYRPGESGGRASIYRVTLSSYEGVSVSSDELSVLGYEYVYVSRANIGAVFHSEFDFNFIPRAGLPPGLDYDFSNNTVGEFPDGIMNWLYNFGSDVYAFFPSVSDLLQTQILGQSFSWLLIQGFLVYCGYVVVKFIVGIVI